MRMTTIDCEYHQPDPRPYCWAGKFRGRPTAEQCLACMSAGQSSPSPVKTIGPGTILKSTLAKFFIEAGSGCQCNARAAQMDQLGPDWCEAHLDLIVGWLKEEAARRNLPFLPIAARLLIRRAIHNARNFSASLKMTAI
jgi:hypothetical protein